MMQIGLYAGNSENPTVRMPVVEGVVKIRAVQTISREGHKAIDFMEPSEAIRPTSQEDDDMVRTLWRHRESSGITNDSIAIIHLMEVTDGHERENLGYQWIFQPETSLQIAQPPGDSLGNLDKADVKVFKWGSTHSKSVPHLSN